MNATVMKIDPRTATGMLSRNVNNRPRNQGHVDMIANEITGGRWALNGQPIILDKDGFVVDGQHRLHAIVQAGLSVEVLVVHGVESSVFSTVDNNKTRSPSDALATMGVPNYCEVSSLLLFILRYETSDKHQIRGRFTQTEALEVLAKHPNAVESVRKVMKYSRGLLPKSAVYGLAYYTKQSDEKLEYFLQQATTGVCESANSPQAKLAARMIKNKSDKAKLGSIDSQAIAIIAWNYYVEGKSPTFIRYSEYQNFPRVK
jgi:hypothetical protein